MSPAFRPTTASEVTRVYAVMCRVCLTNERTNVFFTFTYVSDIFDGFNLSQYDELRGLIPKAAPAILLIHEDWRHLQRDTFWGSRARDAYSTHRRSFREVIVVFRKSKSCEAACVSFSCLLFEGVHYHSYYYCYYPILLEKKETKKRTREKTGSKFNI